MEKTLFLRNIKKGFATNSSSYHTTLIMTEADYKKWTKGEINVDDCSYSEWGEYYETDYSEFTTPNGEKIVVVCEFGYDG